MKIQVYEDTSSPCGEIHIARAPVEARALPRFWKLLGYAEVTLTDDHGDELPSGSTLREVAR